MLKYDVVGLEYQKNTSSEYNSIIIGRKFNNEINKYTQLIALTPSKNFEFSKSTILVFWPIYNPVNFSQKDLKLIEDNTFFFINGIFKNISIHSIIERISVTNKFTELIAINSITPFNKYGLGENGKFFINKEDFYCNDFLLKSLEIFTQKYYEIQ
jgi:hypothetical protein